MGRVCYPKLKHSQKYMISIENAAAPVYYLIPVKKYPRL